MTGLELTAAGFIVALVGLLGTAWWRVYTMIQSARHEAQLKVEAVVAIANAANQNVADLRVLVAERYVSKEGHREATEQIMGAIGAIRGDLSAIRDRLDKAFDSRGRT